MQWQHSTVLVTGAGGFIGSHLLEALVALGTPVRAFIHYNARNDWGSIELLSERIKQALDVVAGDIQDPRSVRDAVAGCDMVFHLAALIAIPYSYNAPQSFVQTNVIGTLNILQACLDEKVERVIHTSTSEVYGTALYTPIDENHPLQAQSPYSASKIAADKLAESFYCTYDLPVVTVRPFNAFGPRQSARAFIPSIASQILSGKREIATGLLSPVRDYTYVKETVKGFIKLAECERATGQTVNLGTGSGISMGDLAQHIAEMADARVRFVTDNQRLRPEKSEVMTLICSNAKLRELTGWVPSTSLEEGLQQTIQYIKENLERYKPQIYNM
jgi:NAD dependent epimerase/dehydratase